MARRSVRRTEHLVRVVHVQSMMPSKILTDLVEKLQNEAATLYTSNRITQATYLGLTQLIVKVMNMAEMMDAFENETGDEYVRLLNQDPGGKEFLAAKVDGTPI